MRTVMLIAHTERRTICQAATRVAEQLTAAGIGVRMVADDAEHVDVAGVTVADPELCATGAEVALALGGDGTFLRAAELARPVGVPLLGVNLGHIGFLAEAEPNALDDTVGAIVAGNYEVEERITVDASVIVDGAVQACGWALNEVSVERTNRERILDISVAVDSVQVLHFGCDGILCSTPTGSTAYGFSAGGPIVWPDVEALLIVPNAAHALFARPLVVGPQSVIDIDLHSPQHQAVISCDGRRLLDVPAGARVRVTRGGQPVRIARVDGWNFADRLVAKFQLPVRSLREAMPAVEWDPDDQQES